MPKLAVIRIVSRPPQHTTHSRVCVCVCVSLAGRDLARAPAIRQARGFSQQGDCFAHASAGLAGVCGRSAVGSFGKRASLYRLLGYRAAQVAEMCAIASAYKHGCCEAPSVSQGSVGMHSSLTSGRGGGGGRIRGTPQRPDVASPTRAEFHANCCLGAVALKQAMSFV